MSTENHVVQHAIMGAMRTQGSCDCFEKLANAFEVERRQIRPSLVLLNARGVWQSTVEIARACYGKEPTENELNGVRRELDSGSFPVERSRRGGRIYWRIPERRPTAEETETAFQDLIRKKRER